MIKQRWWTMALIRIAFLPTSCGWKRCHGNGRWQYSVIMSGLAICSSTLLMFIRVMDYRGDKLAHAEHDGAQGCDDIFDLFTHNWSEPGNETLNVPEDTAGLSSSLSAEQQSSDTAGMYSTEPSSSGGFSCPADLLYNATISQSLGTCSPDTLSRSNRHATPKPWATSEIRAGGIRKPMRGSHLRVARAAPHKPASRGSASVVEATANRDALLSPSTICHLSCLSNPSISLQQLECRQCRLRQLLRTKDTTATLQPFHADDKSCIGRRQLHLRKSSHTSNFTTSVYCPEGPLSPGTSSPWETCFTPQANPCRIRAGDKDGARPTAFCHSPQDLEPLATAEASPAFDGVTWGAATFPEEAPFTATTSLHGPPNLAAVTTLKRLANGLPLEHCSPSLMWPDYRSMCLSRADLPYGAQQHPTLAGLGIEGLGMPYDANKAALHLQRSNISAFPVSMPNSPLTSAHRPSVSKHTRAAVRTDGFVNWTPSDSSKILAGRRTEWKQQDKGSPRERGSRAASSAERSRG
ncbi:hypothetical protein MRB53_040613 [Persea americana]|nr:hypothetical protein MRB53_040613 [Persea americana]